MCCTTVNDSNDRAVNHSLWSLGQRKYSFDSFLAAFHHILALTFTADVWPRARSNMFIFQQHNLFMQITNIYCNP